MEEVKKNIDADIDQLEAFLFSQPQTYAPVKHTFTPGLYIREITMPAGVIVTSKVHKTEHPYIILSGEVVVFTEKDGDLPFKAPYFGITKAGTRRVLRTVTETVWITFHPTDKTTPDEVEEDIIEKHENIFLDENENEQLRKSQQAMETKKMKGRNS